MYRWFQNIQFWILDHIALFKLQFLNLTSSAEQYQTPELAAAVCRLKQVFGYFDSWNRKILIEMAENELNDLPPQIKFCNLKQFQYIFRQWMCRDQMLRVIRSRYNDKQNAAHEYLPPWLMYEVRQGEVDYPARVYRADECGLLYVVLIKTENSMKVEKLPAHMLHPVNSWNQNHMKMIMSHPQYAGVYMDPLGVIAWTNAAFDFCREQQKNK